MKGRADSPALHGTLLGSLLHRWNPLMRLFLDSRFHRPLSRWFVLVSWTGRRTRRVHTIPVSYVRDDTGIFVTTGDRWWRYVVGNGTVRIALAGRWRTARAVPITDSAESIREHDRIFREHPWFRRLSGIPTTSGERPDAAALARSVAAGRTLIRIELETGDPRGGGADDRGTP
ncbi:MAG: hypothetical protein WD830_05190 [Chloroflexota bacterium]